MSIQYVCCGFNCAHGNSVYNKVAEVSEMWGYFPRICYAFRSRQGAKYEKERAFVLRLANFAKKRELKRRQRTSKDTV